ncbi:hypothetical protein BH11ACT6_BH11ACT6_05160 [soil metagenome]
MTAVTTLASARGLSTARGRRRPESLAQFAARLDPRFNITPTIALIGDALDEALRTPDSKLALSLPPRSGKSRMVSQVLPVKVLAENPDAKVILASYADSLAEEHSREARRLIIEHGESLGISLATDKASVSRWRIDGYDGGLLAGGVLSGLTGHGADVLIIDDPIKNQQEADSPTYRRRLMHEYQSTLSTRLMPGATTILIATRWHEDDLLGTLVAQDPDGWTYLNVPAISTAGVPDALHREPGVAMISALGRTGDQFAEIRRGVGERTWAAMYLGVPSAPSGGLIRRDWLDTWRQPVAPTAPTKVVVAIDPADSGQGDETGIVATAMAGGVVSLVADASGLYTSDEWAMRAVRLALDVGASEISVEAFQSGTTYVRVVKEALARSKPNRYITVTPWPPRGSGRGKGDSVARAAAFLQAAEVGTFRLAGHHPEWEQQAVGWQPGMHQPDRVAAAVIGHDVCVHSAGGQVTILGPLDVERRRREGTWRPPPAWMTRRVGGR